ncbi:hypothetical protein ACHAXT_005696 [Thalassiosira profunda]
MTFDEARRRNRQMNEAEDNLFHLQQALLRQELPSQQRWGEIRAQQSREMEEGLAREDERRRRRAAALSQGSGGMGDATRPGGQNAMMGGVMSASFSAVNETPLRLPQKRGSEAMGGHGNFEVGAAPSSYGNFDPSSLLTNNMKPLEQGSANNLDSAVMSNAALARRNSIHVKHTSSSMRRSLQDQDVPGYNQGLNLQGLNSSRGAALRKSYHDAPDDFRAVSQQLGGSNVGAWDARLLARTSFREADERPEMQGIRNDKYMNVAQQLGQFQANLIAQRPNVQANEIQAPGTFRSQSPYTSWLQASSGQPAAQGSAAGMVDLSGMPGASQNQNVTASMKRRRLDSNAGEGLLLEMLTDTVVSPAANKPIYGQEQALQAALLQAAGTPNSDAGMQALRAAILSNNASLSSSLSPFASYAKPAVVPPQPSQDMSLTPLNARNTPITDTPLLFADFMLGAGGGLDDSALPPPPFGLNQNKDIQTSAEVAAMLAVPLQASSEGPLPLPKAKGRAKPWGSRKAKEGTDIGTDKPKPKDTSNHIVTPSTTSIAAVAKEIRASMRDEGASDDAHIPEYASAMEASQASQQAIHDWDRKMGLRRAHSKTMRESCRSRKKVLDFLRGEGAGLLRLVRAKDGMEGANEGEPTVEGMAMATEEGIAELVAAEKPEKVEEPPVAKRHSGKLDDDLAQLFRRASLDHEKPVLPADILAVARPPPLEDSDRRQFHATSA